MNIYFVNPPWLIFPSPSRSSSSSLGTPSPSRSSSSEILKNYLEAVQICGSNHKKARMLKLKQGKNATLQLSENQKSF